MFGRTVTAPNGRRWRVSRRWLPRIGTDTVWERANRRFRHRRKAEGALDAADAAGCLFDPLEGLAIFFGVIVVLGVLVFFVLPMIFVLVDLVFVLVLAVIGVIARILFRRPWTVEACCTDGTVVRSKVVGWRASGRRCDELAEQVKAGRIPT